jgi:alpha-1,6-mannosyltransferase
VVAATGLGWRWLHVLGADHGARSVWSVSTWVASLAGRGASLALLVLVVAAVWVAALRGRDPWWCLGVALLALFLLGPMAQPWYLLWALLPLAVGAGERTRTATAVLSATLLLCLVPGGRSWVRPPFYGTPVLAAAVVVSAVALRQRHQQRQQQLVRRQVPVTAP